MNDAVRRRSATGCSAFGAIGAVLWIVLKILLIAVPVIIAVAFYVVWERKLIGWMHVRHGPIVRRHGHAAGRSPTCSSCCSRKSSSPTQRAASSLFIARAADRRWCRRSPRGRWCRSTRRLVLSNVNAGLLYLLAMTSMGVYGIILAGWASNSKYAFLGAMRSAAQIVSLRNRDGLRAGRRADRRRQPEPHRHRDGAGAATPGLFEWFWLPLLPMFVVYFMSGVAETNRAPFDVVEGESEIVAGHMVEYSGSAFALFFLAEYANMILVSFLASILFLGGWLSAVRSGLGRSRWLSVDGLAGWLFAKVFFFASCFIWFRAIVPALPLRPDHAAGLEGVHPDHHRLDLS